ncbi:MipA/OmpV family protein [Vibrio palustris]|uniref:MltA-interacting protein n=1 Tax=Vibrio palustris TaxID=1918946 RepID=A0A1R4B1T9_9VIBR|nr:MipA/OmpV family protein [Vibrio palustris]SJL82888.1 MltA-interacting protein precursor [Vibrio palustris]
MTKASRLLIMAAGGVALLTSYSAYSRSEGLAIGGGYHYSSKVYKETDSSNDGFPMIGYRGEHFYIQGPEMGFGLFPLDAPQNLVWQVTYDGRSFDPKDSDNLAMQELDKRHATGLTGPELRYELPVGQLSVKAALEFTGEHHGYLVDAGWSYTHLVFGDSGITSKVGYQYNSSKMADYLYGVSSEESARSNIRRYDVGGAGEWYAALGVFANVTPNIRVFTGAKLTYLDSDINDSPIVSHDVVHSANVGLTYRF